MSRQRFNDGWRFHLGELSTSPRRVVAKQTLVGGLSDLTVDEIVPTGAGVKSSANILDSDIVKDWDPEDNQFFTTPRPETLHRRRWAHVSLPHDWRVEVGPNPFHSHRPDYSKAMQGFGHTGVAYYRKTWSQPLPAEDERVRITFDGVMRSADYWFNGCWLGSHHSGYTGTTFDLTPMMRDPDSPDGKGRNVLLVRCNNSEAEGWWDEGGGIYRDVWIQTLPEIHLAIDGVNAVVDSVTEEEAAVTVTCEIENAGVADHHVHLHAFIRDPAGVVVTEARVDTSVPFQRTAACKFPIVVPHPRIWDIGQGNLYEIQLQIATNSKVRQTSSTHFGIRTFSFDENGTFLLNNRRLKIKGANLHQDFGGLGNALPTSVMAYKLGLMVDMGCNLVRSAHHPPSEQLLDVADRLGILVITENRLLATSPQYRADLIFLLRRDRIHASVAFWSLGNEEFWLEGTAVGARILREMVATVRSYDTSRPTIIAGATHAEDKAYFGAADVLGLHYGIMMGHLTAIRKRWGQAKPILLDEESLFSNVRGQYEDNVQLGYSQASGSKLGMMAGLHDLFNYFGKKGGRETAYREHTMASLWASFAKDDHAVTGAVVWTGMDYGGEPNPSRWPAVSSSFGCRDFIGIPKDYYWAIRAAFKPQVLVHAFPHWTQPGKEGERTAVHVVSNAERVELAVNGETVGKADIVDNEAVFDGQNAPIYTPGELCIRAFIGDKFVADFTSKTAGSPKALKFILPRASIAADGHDTIVCRLQAVDGDGTFAPYASERIQFQIVSGPGKILGVHNGDSSSVMTGTTSVVTLFRGWAVVHVQCATEDGKPAEGEIRVRAVAEGLASAETVIRATFEGAEDPVSIAAEEEVGGIHRYDLWKPTSHV